MTPTKEQQALIDADGQAIKGIAFAGTGKTSTLEARAHARKERGIYLSFNKSVQVEAERRFPKHIKAITQHGLAFREVMGRGSRYRMSQYGNISMFSIAKRFRLDYYMASLVVKTIENFCASADSDVAKCHVEPDWIGKYQYDITDVTLDTAKKVWGLLVTGSDADFLMTHSVYLKLYQLSKPKLGYPEVLLDEAQDTNPVVHDIVFSQAQYGSRVVLVGDPYQQIYAWRGAVDAMSKVNCDAFHLTQSWRFGPQIAGVANHILNAFFNEQRPLIGNGPEGVIASTDPAGKYTFLTRTNAFLFAKASQMAGKAKMFVPGRGQNGELPIFNTINDVFAMYQGGLDWRKRVRDAELKHFEDYQQLEKFVEDGLADPEWNVSVAMIQKYGEGIPAQIQAIKNSLVTREEDANITLITAHRAKGLEWDQVVLGQDFRDLFTEEGHLRTIGENPKTEIKQDEINLLYVAATRAKKRLTVNGQLQMLLTSRKAEVSSEPAKEPAIVSRPIVEAAPAPVAEDVPF